MNKLIIFDFDGIIVDTEYQTFLFYKKLLVPYNILLNETDFQLKIGRKSIDFFKDVLKERYSDKFAHDLIQQKRSAFLANITTYVKPIPEGIALVKECAEAGLCLVIGSQNEPELINKALDTYHLRPYFHSILSMQEIRFKKPNPEFIILAMKKTGVPVNETIVIDDAPYGIEAGKKIGCKTIGLAATTPPKLLTGADYVVTSLSELGADFLKNFHLSN
jgi:HAD superfamily hydrolase (TIGR01509 family)